MDDNMPTKAQVSSQLAALAEEKRQLEVELAHMRQARETYQALYDSAPIPYQSLDSAGKILNVNDAWVGLMGYEREEVLGCHIIDFLQPGQDEELHDRFSCFLREGIVCGAAYDFKRKDATTFRAVVEGRTSRGADDNLRTHCLLFDLSNDLVFRRIFDEYENKQRMLFENSPAVTLVVDPETGDILNANAAALDLYGYTYDEMISLSVLDINVTLDREGLLAVMGEMLKKGAKRYQFTHRTKSGDLRHVEVHASVVAQEGRPLIYSTILDITEQVNNERQRRELGTVLSAILDNATAVIFAKDMEGRYLFMSKRGEKYMDHTVEDALGRTDFDLYEADTARLFYQQDQEVMASRRPAEYQQTVIFQEKEYAWHQVKFPLLDEDGTCQGVCGMSTDMTSYRDVTREVKAANEQVSAMNEQLIASNQDLQSEIERRTSVEAELREREVLLRSIFRAVPIGIGLSKNQVFQWTNVSFQEMLGYSSEELERAEMRIIFKTEAGYAEVGECMREVRQRGVAQAEVQALTRNGESLDIIMHFALINPEEISAGVVFTAMDVTDRNRVQVELLMAKDRAEIANRTKNEFLANMSHEIRTPLNGVMGMLQLLETTGLDDEQEDYVNTALGSSRGLLTILNDILDLSIIEAGKMDIRTEPFGIVEFVDDVVKVFRHQAEDKGLRLTSYVHERVSRRCVGDRGRIRQVLFNLLGNALKFTAQGEVSVEVYPLQSDTTGRIRMLFAVSDTGIGIAEEDQEQVFESFTQVDGSFTRGFQGTGLGLGIVKRLVELMGGHVNIGSKLGQGTCVHLCLPFDVPDDEREQPDEPLLIRRFPPGTRVLVVEDSRPNRIMVMRFLAKLGVEVESAENGAEALAILQSSEAFHCILMDVQMPEMDGMEATRNIRLGKSGKTESKVPIVALTAHAMKGDREMFLDSGMDAYLAKPIDIVDLGNLLSRIIRSDKK